MPYYLHDFLRFSISWFLVHAFLLLEHDFLLFEREFLLPLVHDFLLLEREFLLHLVHDFLLLEREILLHLLNAFLLLEHDFLSPPCFLLLTILLSQRVIYPSHSLLRSERHLFSAIWSGVLTRSGLKLFWLNLLCGWRSFLQFYKWRWNCFPS